MQHDRFNRSAISTTVVVAITSNLRLAAMPGDVRLRKGEANLARASVVNVSQLRTMDRTRLTDEIGSLTPARMREVLGGVALVLGLDDCAIVRSIRLGGSTSLETLAAHTQHSR